MANITKRGSSFLIRVSDGYTADGKQVFKTETFRPPEGTAPKKALKLAQQEAALFEKRVQSGLVAETPCKFSEFVDRWFRDYAEIQLRPKTLSEYRRLMERILPYFGHIRIDRITPADLMSFYRSLSEENKAMTFVFAGDLKAEIKRSWKSVAAFAENTGASRAAITNSCQGRAVSEKNARAIAKGLNRPFTSAFRASRTEQPLSAETIGKYHRVLSSIFQTAVEWQVIVSNPCSRVKPPRSTKEEALFLDADQAIHLLELLNQPSVPVTYRCAITVLLLTGMRRGELCGLMWSDIDFEHQLISISRTSQYLPDRGIFTDETKNRSSCRVIRAAGDTTACLRDLRKWQLEEKMRLGPLWEDSNQVITTPKGAPINPDTLTSWFHSFIVKTDLPPIHLHSLRHTAASLSILNGVSVTTVAGQLGHSSPNTTTKVYSHAIKTAEAAAAEMLADLLRPAEKNGIHSA